MDDDDKVINRKVTDISDGAAGVILDFNDQGRVKVQLISGGKVRYYDRRNAGNKLKPRTVQARITKR